MKYTNDSTLSAGYVAKVCGNQKKKKHANDTYTLLAVKHIAEVFVGFRVFADKSEYPFICFVVCTEGYPVQLTVVQHILRNNKKIQHSLFTAFMIVDNESRPSLRGPVLTV